MISTTTRSNASHADIELWWKPSHSPAGVETPAPRRRPRHEHPRPVPRAELVTAAAEVAGVCARPVISRVTDIDTGETRVVPIACGATRASKCKPCAEKARKLRMQQCREGWHLDQDPTRPNRAERRRRGPGRRRGRRAGAAGALDPAPPGRPRPAPGGRWTPPTIGRTFTAPDGKVWRPSMFITLTLPSYGRVDRRGRAGRPGQLRLPAGRARRDALLEAGRSVLAEPAPLRRLPGPVLRHRRGPAPWRPAPPRRRPGRDPSAGRPRGAGGDLPPGLVAGP